MSLLNEITVVVTICIPLGSGSLYGFEQGLRSVQPSQQNLVGSRWFWNKKEAPSRRNFKSLLNLKVPWGTFNKQCPFQVIIDYMGQVVAWVFRAFLFFIKCFFI